MSTPVRPVLLKKKNPAVNINSIAVRNAGLVLLNSYIPAFFERLGAVNNGRFVDTTVQADAVHYLQYLATGLSCTDESLLPLNKILCGLTLAHPVASSIEITASLATLIEGLINAVIAHWQAIGASSVNGFRGNWLVRDGLLAEYDDKWELSVESRSYDLLINQSPFSFSIIKYPWMDKPLYVNWIY